MCPPRATISIRPVVGLGFRFAQFAPASCMALPCQHSGLIAVVFMSHQFNLHQGDFVLCLAMGMCLLEKP